MRNYVQVPYGYSQVNYDEIGIAAQLGMIVVTSLFCQKSYVTLLGVGRSLEAHHSNYIRNEQQGHPSHIEHV